MVILWLVWFEIVVGCAAVVLSAGDLLDDKYRVDRLIGRGGMGEVWASRSLEDGRDVAIKVLLEQASRKKDIVARFKREAKIASMISSPFVCGLLDTGHSPDGGLYLVFELLRGEPLSDLLRREDFLPFSEVALLFDDVLRGIIDAHNAGVLHRDLKPGNVFISRRDDRDRAIILDFGVSKILDAARAGDESALTAFDGTVGSFAYMAPEQVRGAARVDERADIYSAGAIAFRALSGRLPFEGITAKMVVSLKISQPPPSLREVTGMPWPKMLEDFFENTLAKNPADRYATAREALMMWREICRQFEQVHERALSAHWRTVG